MNKTVSDLVETKVQLMPPVRPEADTHAKDPLYIGLPNYGNSCYQNATLQSLFGLLPFLNETMALMPGPDEESCRTLRAVAKLMVLRQKALSKSVSSHLKDLRDVLARIDPAFCGNEMQDASEFLLRLLDVINSEIDASRAPANPVRDNFQYQTLESYMCTRCHKSVQKRLENISWFMSVPRLQDSKTPSLQDALLLSMRPDRRELLCQHCKHNECHVTTKISKLPRTLILQLNRYSFIGEESKKIRTNVEIPKFLSLSEYMADDATRPPELGCLRLPSSVFSEEGIELVRPERPSQGLPASPNPATAASDTATLPTPTRPASLPHKSASEATPIPPPPLPPSAPATPQTRFCAENVQSLDPVSLGGTNNYQLVGLVSHHGNATHSGHYVSDVFSMARDRWYHYDDSRVSYVEEMEVLGEGNQRDGYIFFYMHECFTRKQFID